MSDTTENTNHDIPSKSTVEAAPMETETSEVPVISPSANGSEASSSSTVRQEDVKSPDTAADDNFKRPVIGPIRKPSTYTSKTQVNPTKTIQVPSKEEQKDDDKKEKSESEPEQEGIEDKTTDTETDNSQRSERGPENQKTEPSLSPAEKLKQTEQPIPYLEPKWGGRSEKEYSLEVLKNGSIIKNIKLTEKPFYVFGRLPVCDVQLEHPSLSRFHAVLQYCSVANNQHEEGWYLYDLESTHGTWINKLQVKPRVYYRIRVGFVLKFAGSTRLHILQGPDDDQEDESELTIQEMKEERERKKMEDELSDKLEEAESSTKKEEEADGCSWGMGDDAPIDPEGETPFMESLPQNEELYLDDPKKTLKGFFEREGYDLPEYQFEEAGHGKHKCVVEVPVDSPTGQPVYAEAVVAGKRKDAVIACALEACRILDRYGLLRKKEHEARKVKLRDWEDNDYYGSDEDEFLDRTGEIQKKRELRMKRAGKINEKAETFESLSEKLDAVVTEMDDIEKKLAEAKKNSAVPETGDLDALDLYMSSIKKGAIDTKTRMSMKRRLFDLRKDRGRLERLVNIAKPALMPHTSSSKSKLGQTRGKMGGLTRKIGVMGQSRQLSASQLPVTFKPATTIEQSGDAEENDSDDEPEQPSNTSTTTVKSTQPSSTESPNEANTEQTTTTSAPTEPEKSDVKKQSEGDVSEQKPVQNETTIQIPKSTSKSTETLTTVSTDESKSAVEDAPQFVKAKQPKKRHAEQQKPKTKKPKTAPLSKEYATDDPDYAVWVPPQGQTGDGKTHLNAKFGY